MAVNRPMAAQPAASTGLSETILPCRSDQVGWGNGPVGAFLARVSR